MVCMSDVCFCQSQNQKARGAVCLGSMKKQNYLLETLSLHEGSVDSVLGLGDMFIWSLAGFMEEKNKCLLSR